MSDERKPAEWDANREWRLNRNVVRLTSLLIGLMAVVALGLWVLLEVLGR